ncbi:hypothetical protein LC612_41500 [Nostoc sp. CHAB 5834]|nr:hypothetical protein [Nostoc sp. CHAB 5834]
MTETTAKTATSSSDARTDGPYGPSVTRFFNTLQVTFNALGGYLFFVDTSSGRNGELWDEVADDAVRLLDNKEAGEVSSFFEPLGCLMGGDCSGTARAAFHGGLGLPA